MSEYGNRVCNIISETVKRCQTTIYVGGGDRGIYPAGKAITDACYPVKLVRLKQSVKIDFGWALHFQIIIITIHIICNIFKLLAKIKAKNY